jgi:hypothetical protein
MRATNSSSKRSRILCTHTRRVRKAANSSQADLEELFSDPMQLLNKQINTTTKRFWEMFENFKPI